MKNKTIAAVLALFVGVLGIHKFYLGRIGMGILYIFTLGFFLIGAFIDAIILFSMSQDAFDMKYNPSLFKRIDE